ncbi:MAG: hypothetical protein IJW33_05875 [Lentisphaeria bacterium]|nr:hypothetical protein [Lentisphaeria bacterium]
MLELIFTSAKAGLIPGRSGFCSVAWTEGMPQNLVTLLENMSGYNAVYAPDHPMADRNPVSYSYQKIQFGRSELRIVSRIAFAGLDHTGRSNKIAHHIVLNDENEFKCLKDGPVALFMQPGLFRTEWNEPPRLLPLRKRLDIMPSSNSETADTWQQITGDPRWAGYIADQFMLNGSSGCIYLEYDHLTHEDNILQLIHEVTRLLPPEQRREFTFSTCFSAAQTGCSCFLRAALPSCKVLPAIRKFRANELISLITPAPFPENAGKTRNILRSAGEKEPEAITLEEPGVIRLMPTVNARPPVLPPGGFVQTQQAPGRLTDISSDTSKRNRMIIFLALILVLLSLIIGMMIWQPWKLFFKEEKVPGNTPAAAPAVPPPVKEPAPANSGKEDGKVAKKKKTSPKTPTPVKKTDPVKAPPAVKKTDPVKAELSLADAYKLYKEYYQQKGQKSITILLPAALAGTRKVEIAIEDKWLNGMDIKDFISVLPNGVKIHAQDRRDGSVEKDKFMTVVIENGSLVINDSKTITAPKHTHLKEIKFIGSEKICSWSIKFNPKYEKFIPYGKINRNFEYEKSADEKIFGMSVVLENIPNLKDINRFYELWNKAAAEFKKNQAVWSKLPDQKEVLQKAREYEREFETLLGKRSGFDKINKAFQGLYGELVKMNDITALEMTKGRNYAGNTPMHKLYNLIDQHRRDWENTFPKESNIPKENGFWYDFIGNRNKCLTPVNAFSSNQKVLKATAEKLNKILAITGGKVDPAKPEEQKFNNAELLKKLNGNIKKYIVRQIPGLD